MNSFLLFLSLVSVVVVIVLLPLLPSEEQSANRLSEVVSCYTFPSALVIRGDEGAAKTFSQKDPSDSPPIISIDLSTSSESWTFSQFLALIVAPGLFSGIVGVQRNTLPEIPTFRSKGKVHRFLFDQSDPLISNVSFEETSSPEKYLKNKPSISFLGPKDSNQIHFKRSGPHLLAYFAGEDVCTLSLIVAKNLTSHQHHCNGFQLVQNFGAFGIGTKFCNCFDTCGQWFEGDTCDQYIPPDQFVGCPKGEKTILSTYANDKFIQVVDFGTVSPKKCTPRTQTVFFRHGSDAIKGDLEVLTNNSIIEILKNFNVSDGDTINYTQGNTTCVFRMEVAQQQPSPTPSPSSSLDPCAIDSDGDNTVDCTDECPTDPTKAVTSGTCGCGYAEDDSDGDGVVNCLDECELDDQKVVSGICGCSLVDPTADFNSDGGVDSADCVDECPNSTKFYSGICGCDVLDIDSDADGTMDCIDVCPSDPGKAVSSGSCGCGIAENCTISSRSTSISLSSSPSASGSFSPSVSISPSWSPSTSISPSSSPSASGSFSPSVSISPSLSPSTS